MNTLTQIARILSKVELPSARRLWFSRLISILALCLAWPAHSANPALRVQREGSNVVVHYTGWLQSAACVEGPYTNVPSAPRPFLWPVAADAHRFWRAWLPVVKTIAAGSGHTVALRADGSLWAWGANWDGQLGNGRSGFEEGSTVPVHIGLDTNWQTVACGGGHTLALKSDGSLWAWGSSGAGQLGNGTFTSTNAPTCIGVDSIWRAVACGYAHTVALKSDGSLWAWGRNESGELGIGTSYRTNVPVRIGVDTNWQAVACGGYHTVAIKTDRSIWAWGYNFYGQLGNGTFSTSDPYGSNAPVRIGMETNWQTVACGEQFTVAIKTDGSLWAWGYNFNGQLGNGTSVDANAPTRIGTDTGWQTIACSRVHTAALKADGSLWAWGDNFLGWLGNGTFTSTNAPARIGLETNWRSVACGTLHTVALKADRSLLAWGDNYYGQLGNGTMANTNAPARVGAETNW